MTADASRIPQDPQPDDTGVSPASAHHTSRQAWDAAHADSEDEGVLDVDLPAGYQRRSVRGSTLQPARQLGLTTPQLPGQADVLHVRDPRLQDALLRGGVRYATVSEYARGCGIDPTALINQIADHLESGSLAIEMSHGQLFLHTAPQGRPRPDGKTVAVNLWETLRARHSVEAAGDLWQVVRRLQHAGWQVETVAARLGVANPAAANAGLVLGLDLGDLLVPVISRVDEVGLSHADSLLSRLDVAGVRAVAVLCPDGSLDSYTTAIRLWQASSPRKPRLHVMLLEAPRYPVVLLSADDTAVVPQALTRFLT